MSLLPLVTDRLLLRQWRDSDVDELADICTDPVVMEHFPGPSTRAQVEALVDRATTAIDAGTPALFAVEVQSTGEFIGFVGLSVPRFEARFTPCVEVGWRLKHRAWGRGYATEAALASLEHGFDDYGLDLDEIVSFTACVNHRSKAVMLRLGMTIDPMEEFEHPNVPPGHPVRRHLIARLSAEDWRTRRPAAG